MNAHAPGRLLQHRGIDVAISAHPQFSLVRNRCSPDYWALYRGPRVIRGLSLYSIEGEEFTMIHKQDGLQAVALFQLPGHSKPKNLHRPVDIAAVTSLPVTWRVSGDGQHHTMPFE